MIGVNVRFDYDGNFDRDRVVAVADHARALFDGMPGLRVKFPNAFSARRSSERERRPAVSMMRSNFAPRVARDPFEATADTYGILSARRHWRQQNRAYEERTTWTTSRRSGS